MLIDGIPAPGPSIFIYFTKRTLLEIKPLLFLASGSHTWLENPHVISVMIFHDFPIEMHVFGGDLEGACSLVITFRKQSTGDAVVGMLFCSSNSAFRCWCRSRPTGLRQTWMQISFHRTSGRIGLYPLVN